MYRLACLIVFLSLSLNFYFNYHFFHESPAVAQDDYFGEGEVQADDKVLREYTIDIDPKKIEHFKLRLKEDIPNLLPPVESSSSNSSSGADFDKQAEYLRYIVTHLEKFDWKQHQYFINTFQHYRTEIEGLRVHFVRSAHLQTYKRIIPLLLVHNWPSSFWAFYKVIPILSNPNRFGFDFGVKGQFAFDVIVPSIPGMGFSDIPSKPGFGLIESARILCKLMHRLSAQKFFVHGSSDVGSTVGSTIAAICPSAVSGLHLSNPAMTTFTTRSTQTARLVQMLFSLFDSNESVLMQNATNSFYQLWPESTEIAMASSPAGMTSFIFDRWARGTDPDYSKNSVTRLHEFFTVDELITNALLCWITQTVPQGLRMFRNAVRNPLSNAIFRASISTQTGIQVTPATVPQTRSHFEYRYFNITRYTEAEEGGDYLAIQKPSMFAEDIFAFVEQIVG